MPKISLFLALSLTLAGATLAGEVRFNQLGYYPNGNKFIVVANAHSDSFSVCKVTDGTVVLRKALSAATTWAASGESNQNGDFSEYKTVGRYYIQLDDGQRSEPFRIRSDVYAGAYADMQRAFYFWRSSTSIPAANGGKFARGFGHPDTALPYHADLGYLPADAKRDVRGGWYDAGDYGKYVVNAGVSVGILQTLQLVAPNWTGDAVLNLPESGNGRPDLADELRWELDWLLRMQDDDGGVFFKITPKNFEGFVLPQNDPSQRYVIGKTTASTLDFAAMMAQASRRWTAIDPAYADTLKARAIRAYAWGSAHANIQYTQGSGSAKYKDVSTGGYGDNNFSDEFLWAKCELWLTTGDATYKPLASSFTAASMMPDWGNAAGIGLYDLALEGTVLDAGLASAARTKILTQAGSMKTAIAANPYRIPELGFGWGSNGNMGEIGCGLAVAFKLTGDSSYIRAAGEIADYLFGKNPVDMSYVTGEGYRSPRNQHSRVQGGDGIADPIPGYISGGANGSPPSGDAAAYNYCSGGSKPSAACYIDAMGSYSTNEIAINWNAPAVALLGFLETSLGGSTALAAPTMAPEIASYVTGPGSIVASKQTIAIGDTVTFTATADAGKVFLGWGGDLKGTTPETTLVVTKDVFVRGYFQAPDTNLIQNGTASDSLHHWSISPYVANPVTDGLASLEWGADSSLVIHPVSGGQRQSDVYVVQDGLLLGKGRNYVVEFDAHGKYGWAAAARLMSGNTQLAVGNVELDTAWFHYRVTLSSSQLEGNGSLRIEVGGDTARTYIDNVSLTLITGTPPDPLTPVKVTRSNVSHSQLQGHWLDLATSTGDAVQVQVFGLDGRLLGSSALVATGASHIDLAGLVPNHRGLSLVKVRTPGGMQAFKWLHSVQ